jgi:hypothetical protein
MVMKFLEGVADFDTSLCARKEVFHWRTRCCDLGIQEKPQTVPIEVKLDGSPSVLPMIRGKRSTHIVISAVIWLHRGLHFGDMSVWYVSLPIRQLVHVVIKLLVRNSRYPVNPINILLDGRFASPDLDGVAETR